MNNLLRGRKSIFVVATALVVVHAHASSSWAGSVTLVRNWTVSNPNFTDAQMKTMFSATDVADASTTAIPLTITIKFTNNDPLAFTFTNSFTMAAYTGDPNKGSLTASVNAYSRFVANFVLTNGTGNPWGGFVFDIKDNVPGRALPGTDAHPEAAHFHAPKNGPFAQSLAPFKQLTRTPMPDDTNLFNGIATATVNDGVLDAGKDWKPMGLGIHDNITFDKDNKNNTSFVLTLTPFGVPEPSSLVLGAIAALVGYGFHLTRRRRSGSFF